MKYIKQFEKKITSKEFWLVKTKMPDFEIALKKLKLTEFQINYFLNNQYLLNSRMNKIFIPFGLHPTAYYNASNKFFDNNTKKMRIGDFFESSKKDLESQGFNYMGGVDITKQDLLDWKKENTAKKYNI